MLTLSRINSSRSFLSATVLLFTLLGCATKRPAVVVVPESNLPEPLLSLATFMCKHEQVPIPAPSRLPAGARPSDYIRQEDLDFLARKVDPAQMKPPEVLGLAQEQARYVDCHVTLSENLGDHVRVLLQRTRPKWEQKALPAEALAGTLWPEALHQAVERWRQENPATFTSLYSMLFVKTAQGWRTDYQLPEAERGQALLTARDSAPSSGLWRSGERLPSYNVEVTRPEKLSGPIPQYTREALDNRVEGMVIARCIITHEGQVQDCHVTQSVPFMDDAVLEALYACRYKPATVQGEPVNMTYTFNIKLFLPRSLREDKQPQH